MNSRYYTPAIPDGWFQVAYSDELKPGEVLPLAYFGGSLVLFRSESGEASVLDAFCPHLGAHLGYGGKVEGNCIRCPFHAWKFDRAGQCTEVPYAQKIPPKAKIKPWVVRELAGLISSGITPAARHRSGTCRRFPSTDIPTGPTTSAGAGRSARATKRWPKTR